MDEFIILRVSDSYPPEFESIYFLYTARDVAIHMWGKSMGKHLIYKNGKLAYLAHLYPDLDFLEEYLSGDIRYPDLDQ